MNKLKHKEDSLRSIIKEQEKKYKKEGQTINSFLTILIDRILSSKPEGIKLAELNINPSKFLRDKKVFQFEENKILLYGTSENSFILNKWLKELENNNLIIKSNFISYKQESGLSNGSFILEFYYNEQWIDLKSIKHEI